MGEELGSTNAVEKALAALFGSLGLGMGDTLEIKVPSGSAADRIMEKVAEEEKRKLDAVAEAFKNAPGKLEYVPETCPCCGMGNCSLGCPGKEAVYTPGEEGCCTAGADCCGDPWDWEHVMWPEECPIEMQAGPHGLAMLGSTWARFVPFEDFVAVLIPTGQPADKTRMIVRFKDPEIEDDAMGVFYPREGKADVKVAVDAAALLDAWYTWAKSRAS